MGSGFRGEQWHVTARLAMFERRLERICAAQGLRTWVEGGFSLRLMVELGGHRPRFSIKRWRVVVDQVAVLGERPESYAARHGSLLLHAVQQVSTGALVQYYGSLKLRQLLAGTTVRTDAQHSEALLLTKHKPILGATCTRPFLNMPSESQRTQHTLLGAPNLVME